MMKVPAVMRRLCEDHQLLVPLMLLAERMLQTNQDTYSLSDTVRFVVDKSPRQLHKYSVVCSGPSSTWIESWISVVENNSVIAESYTDHSK